MSGLSHWLRREDEPDSPGAMAGVMTGTIVGAVSLSLFALSTPGLISRFGLTTVQVGMLFAIDRLFLVLVSFVTSFLVGKLDLRKASIACVALHSLASIATAFAPSILILVVARVVAAFADSASHAAIGVVVARTKNPTRIIGLTWIVTSLGTAATLAITRPFIEQDPVKVVYTACAIAGVFALPFQFWLPPCLKPVTTPARGHARKIGFGSFLGFDGGGYFLMAAGFLFFIGLSAASPFTALLARHAGLNLGRFTEIAALASLIAIAAPLVPIVIAQKFGLAGPFSIALLAMIFAIYGITAARSPEVFIVAIVLETVVLRIVPSYFYGTVARHDPTGRLSVAMVGASGLGGIVGPTLGGYFAHNPADFTSLGLVAGGAALVGGLCVAIFALRGDRRKAAQSEGQPANPSPDATKGTALT